MERYANARYGIGEWYGFPIHLMDVETRQHIARVAESHVQSGSSDSTVLPPCPFSSGLLGRSTCNKNGGICSIQPVTLGVNGQATLHPDDLVTVCPNRFLEERGLISWVAEVMLGTAAPKAIREVAFLNSSSIAQEDRNAKSGRIDWLLVDDSESNYRYCALEVQALYFSGHRMTHDISRYLVEDEYVYPSKSRRPDYRSSGPKRLAPQLSVKVPLLRNWGIKTAVLVDRYFFDQMAHLVETIGSDHDDRLAASDVVWFIAEYQNGKLVPGEIRYASLAASIESMNATQVMSKNEFIKNVTHALNTKRSTKVIDLSS